MDDALFVRVLEGLGHLSGDGQRLVDWNRPLEDAVGQRRPFDQFHHQGGRAVGVLQPVDGGDARVAERGQHPGLALEPREPIWMVGKGRQEDFDGDVALELRVARAVHLPHATRPDTAQDRVGPEPGPAAQRGRVIRGRFHSGSEPESTHSARCDFPPGLR